MRERGGRTLVFVFKAEDAAVVTIARTVAPGSGSAACRQLDIAR